MADLLQKGGTGFVKNVLRQMGVEAGEESASYVLNYAADKAAQDPNARFSLQELAESALGGAVSGLAFGAAGSVIGRAKGDANANAAQTVPAEDLPANKTDPVMTEPVRTGRATTIQSPYTGKTPVNTSREAAQPIAIDANAVEDARQTITAAQQSGTFAKMMKTVLGSIFQREGGRRAVTVQGVSFDGKPYDVSIGNKVASKVASDPNMTPEKLAVFSNIDNAIKTAEYVGSGKYNKNSKKQESVIRYDYFEKNIEISGNPYVMTFDVEVYTSKNNFRTYRVIDKMSLTPLTEAAGPQPTSPNASGSLVNNSIPQPGGNSNPQTVQTPEEIAGKLLAAEQELREAKSLLPGPMRDRAVARAQEKLDKAAGEVQESAAQTAPAEEIPANKTGSVMTEPVKNRTLNKIIVENHEAIAQTGVLAELTGNEFSGGAKLVDQVTEFFKSIGNKVTRIGFGDVTLNRSGARDSISHGIGRNKAIAFSAVPYVIENGTIIDAQQNWKGRGYDTVTFGGLVKINGVDYDMGVIVKRHENVKNQSKYYLHEVLLTNEENGTVSFKTGTREGYPSDTMPFNNNSIPQSEENSNPQTVQTPEEVQPRRSHGRSGRPASACSNPAAKARCPCAVKCTPS